MIARARVWGRRLDQRREIRCCVASSPPPPPHSPCHPPSDSLGLSSLGDLSSCSDDGDHSDFDLHSDCSAFDEDLGESLESGSVNDGGAHPNPNHNHQPATGGGEDNAVAVNPVDGSESGSGDVGSDHVRSKCAEKGGVCTVPLVPHFT